MENAKKLAAGFPRTTSISLDVNDAKALDDQVSKHALVVSLIPYTFHEAVILAACKHRTNVVTTSYISPAIAALEGKIKEAGITVMNEIGLDPGQSYQRSLRA